MIFIGLINATFHFLYSVSSTISCFFVGIKFKKFVLVESESVSDLKGSYLWKNNISENIL